MLDQSVQVKPINPTGTVTITPAALVTRDMVSDQARQFYNRLSAMKDPIVGAWRREYDIGAEDVGAGLRQP